MKFMNLFRHGFKQDVVSNYDAYKANLSSILLYMNNLNHKYINNLKYSCDYAIANGFNENGFSDNPSINVGVGYDIHGNKINPETYHFSNNDITLSQLVVAHEYAHLKQIEDFKTNPNVDRYDVYQHIALHGFFKSYPLLSNYHNNPLELKAERSAIDVTNQYLQSTGLSEADSFELLHTALKTKCEHDNYFINKEDIENAKNINDILNKFDDKLQKSRDVYRKCQWSDNDEVGFDETVRLCNKRKGNRYVVRDEYVELVNDMMDNSYAVFEKSNKHDVGYDFLEKAAILTLHFDKNLKNNYKVLENEDVSLEKYFDKDIVKDIIDPAPITIDMTEALNKKYDIYKQISNVEYMELQHKQCINNKSDNIRKTPRPLPDISNIILCENDDEFCL